MVAETYTDNTILLLTNKLHKAGSLTTFTCSATSTVTKPKTKIDNKKVPELSGFIEQLKLKFKTIQRHCQNLQFFHKQ